MGAPVTVPYEATAGRRVNVIGAHFTQGPLAGKFCFRSYAKLPEPRSKDPEATLARQAQVQELSPGELGKIDAQRFLEFIWEVAGRPAGDAGEWKRERRLAIVLDNYSVHHSRLVTATLPLLQAAQIELFYLPAYCPELSRIEPVWRAVKHFDLRVRSYSRLGPLKRAIDEALARKAVALRARHSQTTRSSGPDT